MNDDTNYYYLNKEYFSETTDPNLPDCQCDVNKKSSGQNKDLYKGREKCGKWDWHPENWCFVKEKCKNSKKSDSLNGHWWYEGCTPDTDTTDPNLPDCECDSDNKSKNWDNDGSTAGKNTCGNWDAYGKNWCYVKEKCKNAKPSNDHPGHWYVENCKEEKIDKNYPSLPDCECGKDEKLGSVLNNQYNGRDVCKDHPNDFDNRKWCFVKKKM